MLNEKWFYFKSKDKNLKRFLHLLQGLFNIFIQIIHQSGLAVELETHYAKYLTITLKIGLTRQPMMLKVTSGNSVSIYDLVSNR